MRIIVELLSILRGEACYNESFLGSVGPNEPFLLVLAIFSKSTAVSVFGALVSDSYSSTFY